MMMMVSVFVPRAASSCASAQVCSQPNLPPFFSVHFHHHRRRRRCNLTHIFLHSLLERGKSEVHIRQSTTTSTFLLLLFPFPSSCFRSSFRQHTFAEVGAPNICCCCCFSGLGLCLVQKTKKRGERRPAVLLLLLLPLSSTSPALLFSDA